MATAPTYCTHKQLKRIFPQMDAFDNKRQIVGWSSESLDAIGLYVAYNSGLVTQLFIDGASQEAGNQTVGTSAATAVNNGGGYTATATTIVVDNGGVFTDPQYIKIGSEILGITAISTHSLTVTRGELGTSAAAIADDASVYQHFNPSANGQNLYDSDNDFIIMRYGSNPVNLLTEGGEDFTDLISQYLGDASRFLDSRLDPNLPREQLKDKSGNFDYLIIRTAGLLAAAFLVKSQEPTSEIGIAFMEEAELNITNMNEGKAALSYQTTADTSKGVIRDVTYTSGSIRPVDTRGRARGVDYDLVKVSIESGEGGVLGTARYTVTVKDSTKLKNNVLIDSEVITGDFQSLAYGLEIRFAGSADNSVATANDEWEIEVGGAGEEQELPGNVRSIQLTRGGRGGTPPLSSDYKRRESEEWR